MSDRQAGAKPGSQPWSCSSLDCDRSWTKSELFGGWRSMEVVDPILGVLTEGLDGVFDGIGEGVSLSRDCRPAKEMDQ